MKFKEFKELINNVPGKDDYEVKAEEYAVKGVDVDDDEKMIELECTFP